MGWDYYGTSAIYEFLCPTRRTLAIMISKRYNIISTLHAYSL